MESSRITADELPKISGEITDMCAQNENTGVNANGVFTSFKSGGCARASSVAWDAHYDSVRLLVGDDKAHNNLQPYQTVYIFMRSA